LQFINELLAELLILEIALVCVVEGFPTHPINACRFRTVVVEDVL